MENRCRWILTRITLAELTASLVAGHCMVCGARASTRSISSTAHFEHRALLTPNSKDVQNSKKIQTSLVENKSESFGQQFRSVEKYFKQRLQSIYSWGTSDPSSRVACIKTYQNTLLWSFIQKRRL